MQTRERRIYLHWRSLRRNYDYRNGAYSIWMRLARQWRMPIREVREIVETQKNGA